jgi:NAD+ kinase
MIIALYPNKIKKDSEALAQNISEFLHAHHITVVAEPDIAKSLGAESILSVSPSEVDFIISIGGDGTLLRLIHQYPEIQAPIMPINLGGLGFMADITRDDIYPNLQNLLEGNFWIQERMMMEGISIKKERTYAVNEITVHRARNSCLIDLAIYLDGKYLNTFSADGVILATPTGSTAYSLAAGGPILTPELNAFILTPICPHTISNRPIVFLPREDIRIEYLSAHEPVEICYDGFASFSMSTSESLKIIRSERSFKLVCMINHDYFSTLRTKLGWSGKLRS